MQDTSQVLSTCNDVFNFIAPNAGGSVPSETSKQYANWLRWLAVKQEEFARRGFWRRLLVKDTVTASVGDTTALLPDAFHKANGLYVFQVGDEEWAEEGQNKLNVSMVMGGTDHGKWQVEFVEALSADIAAPIWYYRNPPVPTAGTDKITLPGDMLAFGLLAEYFRSNGALGSQDDARTEAENRFTSYLNLENIPARYELMTFSMRPRKIINIWNRRLYNYRPDRHTR
jgi:hypothetical protein